jgi:hypothetical protein
MDVRESQPFQFYDSRRGMTSEALQARTGAAGDRSRS